MRKTQFLAKEGLDFRQRSSVSCTWSIGTGTLASPLDQSCRCFYSGGLKPSEGHERHRQCLSSPAATGVGGSNAKTTKAGRPGKQCPPRTHQRGGPSRHQPAHAGCAQKRTWLAHPKEPMPDIKPGLFLMTCGRSLRIDVTTHVQQHPSFRGDDGEHDPAGVNRTRYVETTTFEEALLLARALCPRLQEVAQNP